jgi:hypothetical protein
MSDHGELDAERSAGRLISRPLILVGAPRSGTTMLFQVLSTHPDLWSLYRESQPILDRFFPVSMVPGASAVVSKAQVDAPTAASIEQAFFDAVGNVEQARWPFARGLPLIVRNRLSDRLRTSGQRRKAIPLRMVEKTPDNCFRIGLLDTVFPDALYVHVLRDPRGSVASIFHGWRDESRFRRYPLPPGFTINGYEGSQWCFGLIPGWEQLNGRSLIEVCAQQWIEYNNACLRDLPDDNARVLAVHYEELAATPGAVLERLARWADLDARPLKRYEDKVPVVNTWTRPSEHKWKRFEPEINSVLEMIRPMSERLGYELQSPPRVS